MVIGHVSIKKFNGQASIFESDITSFTVNGGRVYAFLDGSFQPSLPFARGNLYEIHVTGDIGEMNIQGIYEDYIFNAGASDYVDLDGTYHTGTVTLSNQLQFRLLSE